MTTQEIEEGLIRVMSRTQNELFTLLSQRNGRELPPDAKVLDDAKDIMAMAKELKNDLEEIIERDADLESKMLVINDRHHRLNKKLVRDMHGDTMSSNLLKCTPKS